MIINQSSILRPLALLKLQHSVTLMTTYRRRMDILSLPINHQSMKHQSIRHLATKLQYIKSQLRRLQVISSPSIEHLSDSRTL